MGPRIRIGALDADGLIVDLAAAHRLQLINEGVAMEAAMRISSALLPCDMVGLIEGGARSLDAAREAMSWVARHAAALRDVVVNGAHMLAPIPHPPMLRDFMGFEQHLRNIYPKLGRDIPPEWYNLPVYYKGNPGSIATNGDAIPIPSYGEELDIEFELAFVIGRGGSNIPADRAREHIFGYMIYNDLSERRIQAREMSVGLGPAKGKDFCGGHVLGPTLVTADEIPDIYDLKMTARVNGEVWCETNSNTIHWSLSR